MEESGNMLILREILENQRAIVVKVDGIASEMVRRAEFTDMQRRLEEFALKREFDGFRDEQFKPLRAEVDNLKSARLPAWLLALLIAILGGAGSGIAANLVLGSIHASPTATVPAHTR